MFSVYNISNIKERFRVIQRLLLQTKHSFIESVDSNLHGIRACSVEMIMSFVGNSCPKLEGIVPNFGKSFNQNSSLDI